MKRNRYMMIFGVQGIQGERFTSFLDYTFIADKIRTEEIYYAILNQAAIAVSLKVGYQIHVDRITLEVVSLLDSCFIGSRPRVDSDAKADLELDMD